MMKDALIGNNRGSSTLELLIAFAVLTLTLTAVIIFSFGNQSLLLYTKLNQLALQKAGRELGSARTQARENFLLPSSYAATPDDIYQKTLTVIDFSQCRKRITSLFTWQVDVGRPQEMRLATDVTDLATIWALGGDCLLEPPSDLWKNPRTESSIDIDPSGQKGTDVDVVEVVGARYALVTSVIGDAAKNDFWVIHLGPPLAIIGQLNTGPGLNALDGAGGTAYVANDKSSEQLQVINITNPASPTLEATASRTLPGVGNSYPQGWSIYYYNNYVYIGTRETAGNEFHIYDVTLSANPIWRGSIEINHNVNKIIVRDQIIGGILKRLAYLATSADSKEVMVIDVTDPTAITELGGGFDALGDEDGTALFLIGTKLYLGREHGASGRPDFYILDVPNPMAITELGSKNLGIHPGTNAVGIVVSGDLAFVATDDSTAGFQVWNISNPASITAPSLCNIYNYSEKASGIDFSNNRAYISNQSNNAFRVIYDDTSTAC